MKGFVRISILLVLALLLVPMMAQATPIKVGFYNITNNGNDDLSGQLYLAIYAQTDALSTYSIQIAADQVLFAFTNNVGIPSNVSEIYIDNGPIPILNLVSVITLAGDTKFHADSKKNKITPVDLPSGKDVGFKANLALSAASNNPSPKNGINENTDILGILYDVDEGISGILNAIEDGSLRIGLHVQSIGKRGGSDSYINTTPTNAVPEPSTLMLLGTGLIGIGLYRWRRKKG